MNRCKEQERKRLIFRTSSLFVLLFFCLSQTAAALPADQKALFNKNILYYDIDAGVCLDQANNEGLSGKISGKVGNGLPENVKKKMQEIYIAAGKKFGVDPNFVATFYYIENVRSGDSTNNADSASGTPVTGNGKWREPASPYGKGQSYGTSTASAQGPHQFIPSTWAAYAVDGNGDGKKDVLDLSDAAFGAAKYLAATGAKNSTKEADLRKAAFAYNHSDTYVQSAINTYKFLSGKSQSDVTVSGSSQCEDEAGSFASVDGYTWPINLGKSDVSAGYNLPCASTCHHDGTPAFDLAAKETVSGGDDAKTVSKSTLAITDGTIDGLGIYNGITGCYSLQLKSSKDGYSYWYGHIRRPSVKNKDTVKTGDKIAEVGERKCTGNGSYPHLHIDRGSPKGNPGGRKCCRDTGFVDVINKLYNNLPK